MPYWYSEPSQKSRLPNPTFMQRCCPRLHAVLYKYFGEKTVQMKRCVRKSVQAPMTKNKLLVTKRVSNARWRNRTSFSPFTLSRKSIRFVADVQNIGPAQLLTNVSMPTARTL